MVSNDPRPTGDAGRQGNRDRRVRFANNAEILEIQITEEDTGPADRRRQTILPGEDEGTRARRAAADREMPPDPEGPIRSLDPALAATRRARFRAEATRMQLLEDTSMPDDLAAAEEDYEEPEELYNEEGIPIEPFHLRAEREAGYFDAEGNYLEYRLDAEDTDAWLESIMDEHRQVRADTELAARRRKAAAAAGLGSGAMAGGAASGAASAPAGTTAKKGRRQRGGGGGATTGSGQADAKGDADADDDNDDDDDGPYDMHMLDDTGAVLEEDERAVYQKRVADLLQPGETPLDGLRRLGKVMHGEPAAAAAAAASGSTAAGAARSPPATASGAGAGADAGAGAGAGNVDGLKVEAAGRGGDAGGDGAGVAVDDDVQMKTSAGDVAAHGGGEAGDGRGGGGGAAGSMTHFSCGERQRLRKQRRREQQATEDLTATAAMPSVQLPPPPRQQQDRLPNEAEGAGNMVTETAAAAAVDPTRRSLEEVGGQKGIEAEGRQEGERRRSDGDAEMKDVGMEQPKDETAAAAATVATEPRPGDAPPSPPARQSVAEATAAAAARRRAPAGELSEAAKEARRQFDTLTSYANLLLSAGMYDVYGSTREQLLRAAQRVLGVNVVRSLTVEGQRPVGQAATAIKTNPKRAAVTAASAAAVPGEGGGVVTGKRKRRSVDDATSMAGQPDDGDGDQITAAGASGVGGGGSAAKDGDVDMFGDDDEDEDKGRDAGGGGGGGDGSGSLQLQAGAARGPASTSPPAGTDPTSRATAAATALTGPAEVAGGGGPSVTSAVTASPGPPLDRWDFVLDPDSGYLYSSQLGYYYDTATGLYGDANTGLWYRYVAGEDAGAGGSGDEGGDGAVPSGRFELATAAEQQRQQQQQQEEFGQGQEAAGAAATTG